MKIGKARLALAAIGAVTLTTGVIAQSAFADYAPSSKDVVGVGSDTVQYASDFISDEAYNGDTGFNASFPANKVINFDATPDANARLAYGSQGVDTLGASQATPVTNCGPGTGPSAGTAAGTSNHSESAGPCVLNPTIVLREGQQPVQRPNGSGAGASAILADYQNQTGGHALDNCSSSANCSGGYPIETTRAGKNFIDYTRASSDQISTLTANFSDIVVGTDTMQILSATTSNAVALTKTQLSAIYQASVGQANLLGGTGCVKWSDVGGTSSDAIIPVIPQLGSGTRNDFLKDTTGSKTTPVGTCVKTGEENDPTAIYQQGTGTSVDAIEPMSAGRLDLFNGVKSDGATQTVSGGANAGKGFFIDPSCALLQTPSGCPATPNNVNPSVKLWTSGYTFNRTFRIYFRAADVNSTTKFEPGGKLNWVRTLFANPCSGTYSGGTITPPTIDINTGVVSNPSNCQGLHTTGSAGSYAVTADFGPGGAPLYADTSAGYPEIDDAGVVPAYRYDAIAT